MSRKFGTPTQESGFYDFDILFQLANDFYGRKEKVLTSTAETSREKIDNIAILDERHNVCYKSTRKNLKTGEIRDCYLASIIGCGYISFEFLPKTERYENVKFCALSNPYDNYTVFTHEELNAMYDEEEEDFAVLYAIDVAKRAFRQSGMDLDLEERATLPQEKQ